jgi:hypothetical protein
MYCMAIDGSVPCYPDGDYSPRSCSTLASYFNQGYGIVCFKVVCRFMDWRYGAKLFFIRLCVWRRSTFGVAVCAFVKALFSHLPGPLLTFGPPGHFTFYIFLTLDVTCVRS